MSQRTLSITITTSIGIVFIRAGVGVFTFGDSVAIGAAGRGGWGGTGYRSGYHEDHFIWC